MLTECRGESRVRHRKPNPKIRQPNPTHRQRRSLRLPRTQRRRQNHHHTHASLPNRAHQRQCHRRRLQHPARPLKVRQSVGILTENPSLYKRLTALENMDFFAQAYGLNDPTERRRRIQELLEFFHLWERRNDKVAGFSKKGMKQKLAIVHAIVHTPNFCFFYN